MCRPMFSIITVCYNSGQTIERTICSVLNQTFKDYEYWIIDGGSTDSTLDIVTSYTNSFDGKLFVISEPDLGIYNAMNKGIKHSKGRIIGIINSDDWLEPDALSLVAESASNCTDAVKHIYCGWVNFHYDNGKTIVLRTNETRHMRYHKKVDMGVRHPATFVGHYVYDKLGIFDEGFKIMADADFIFRCTEAQIPFIFLNSVLTNMSDGGVSNKFNLGVYNADIKRMCHKHTKSKIKYIILVGKKLVKFNLKFIIPQRLLRFYRSID